MVCDPVDNRCRSQPLEATCSDGVQNGAETGIDCGSDCPPCGNGLACRGASDCQSQVCDNQTCATPRCGDRVVNQPSEVCDEGGPTATCNASCVPASCGDGMVDPNEECDDDGDSVSCDVDCTTAECGDSYLNTVAGEQCDMGGVNTMTCDADCSEARCGDGYANAEANEVCDDGGVNTSACDADCSAVQCGDRYVNTAAGEACDEGGVDAPACDADCSAVQCGDSYVNTAAGEACDAGGMNTRTCDADCSAVQCGDRYVNTAASEVCDEGGVNTSACDADCTAVRCGDGYLNTASGEQCDDGNNVDGDGCPAVCTFALRPGNTNAVATRDGWSVRCLAWSGEQCTHPQMRMDCSVCSSYTACGVWHDITIFNNGDRRTSMNFCAIATGNAAVTSEGSGGTSTAPRGCGWSASNHPICETTRASYHAAGFGIMNTLGLLLEEAYCGNDPVLLALECTGW